MRVTFIDRYVNNFLVFGSLFPHSISFSKILSATTITLNVLFDANVTDFPKDLVRNFNADTMCGLNGSVSLWCRAFAHGEQDKRFSIFRTTYPAK